MKQCLNCGGRFSPCSSCEKSKTYYGYKKDFCKPECFQSYMKHIEVKKMIEKKLDGISIRGRFRGKVYDCDKMVDLIDYNFNDLKGDFIDHYGEKRNIYDFQYMYITKEVLEDIFKEIYELGIQEGKNKNNKKLIKK